MKQQDDTKSVQGGAAPGGKTILVTGGAGFVGSHLCERLVSEGCRVISLDNYFTGSKDNHVEGVEYREGHTKDIEKHVPEKVDLIYHLGEYSRVRQSLEEPEVVWDLNMDGTFGVLSFWKKQKCKLVYAGSSTKFVPSRDDGVDGRGLAPYTWSKAVNSELVSHYSRWYNLPYVTVYFYNVYGPRELTGTYGAVVGIFKDRMRKGKSLKVASPGTQSRCFTHVDDTIDGIILAAQKGEGDGYGIGAKECYTLLELAEMFGGDIEMIEKTKSTRSTSEVDSTKVCELGWKVQKSLRDYIAEVKKENI